jgi:subtilisin family serine protease
MLARRLPVVILLFFYVSLAVGHAQNQSRRLWTPAHTEEQPKYASGEILVKFKRGSVSRSSAVHSAIGGRVVRNLRAVDGLQLVQLPSTMSVQAAVSAYRAHFDVEYAEPNYIVKQSGIPNDPLVPQQWALSNAGGEHAKAGADIQAFNAWGITTGSSSVVVAVIDFGVDYLHPDLAANIYTNSADCNSNGVDDDGDGYVDDCHGINTYDHTSNPMDDVGHGTHIAGIIGAIGNNGLGVSGVNWNVQILPCKFLNSQGYGTVAGAIECLSYVKTLKDRGVNIVATNNSWGGVEYSAALNDAIAAQRDDGILFVAAAGNEFSNNDFTSTYPANVSYSNVISVASSTNADRMSDF